MSPRTCSRGAAVLVAVALSFAPAACGSATPDTIDREVFIDTYVDLRVTALDTDSLRLSDEGRAEVLARHGVTVQDLETFAEVHARDFDFMRDVWNEVELRLDRPPGS